MPSDTSGGSVSRSTGSYSSITSSDSASSLSTVPRLLSGDAQITREPSSYTPLNDSVIGEPDR